MQFITNKEKLNPLLFTNGELLFIDQYLCIYFCVDNNTGKQMKVLSTRFWQIFYYPKNYWKLKGRPIPLSQPMYTTDSRQVYHPPLSPSYERIRARNGQNLILWCFLLKFGPKSEEFLGPQF